MLTQEISPTNPKPDSPRQAVLEMMLSYVKPQLLYVATRLGLPDLLKDSPQTLAQLVCVVQADPAALRRLLYGLVNIGVLFETSGKFGLTAQGQYLVRDVPGSLREIVILQGEEVFQAWGQLLYSVQTGKPAFEYVFGSEFFQYLSQNPQSQARFNNFMSTTSHLASKALAKAYDFGVVQKVVDIGGSNGVLLSTILEANPHLHGILFDIAAGDTQTAACLQASGVASRCRAVAGDFFEAVPTGGDLYILSQILHDWDDERCLTILKNCRRAMPPHAKLILFELIMPEQPQTPSPAIERDLVMLVLTGGRERTISEFQALLARADFALTRTLPTQHCRSLLEASPAERAHL